MKRAIKTATAAERAYQDRARSQGCVVCRFRQQTPADQLPDQVGATEIHHRNLGDLHGQKQIGQGAVVAMCEYHHRGLPLWGWSDDEMREEFGPSYQLHAKDFRAWTADVLPGYGRGTEAWQNYYDEVINDPDGR